MSTEAGAVRRRYTKSELGIIWGAILVGIALLSSALFVPMLRWFPAREPSWWGWLEAVLLNVGAAVLLLAPIEWFSSRLRRGVESSEKRQTALVGQVREEVEEAREEAANRAADLEAKVASLAELNEQVGEKLDARDSEDEATFRAFAEAGPTRSSVNEAISRAVARGLINPTGVRVPISNQEQLRLVFHTSASQGLVLELDDIDGTPVETIGWPTGATAQTVLVEVGEAVDRAGSSERIDPTLIFERLSESLLLAARERGARPLVEFFPPQWVVTTEALVGVRDRRQPYQVVHNRPDRIAMDAHVKDKPWLDYDSYDAAHEVASYLYPVTEDQKEIHRRMVVQQMHNRTVGRGLPGAPRDLG